MCHEMFSCDSLGIPAHRSADGRNMLGKNSDRPICESQPLVWFSAADHAPGSTVDCTGTVIPQASHTLGVLGSQPYWIWGFEMGVNERGVVIANEAEFSRDFGTETVEGLLGMDLLRLGLERGTTAHAALDVIVGLLAQYGQNHNANALYDRRYENSFLIMDEQEIWVLETAGRRYAAQRVNDVHALGNTYSLGGGLELSSPDLEQHARTNGWLLPNQEFNFEQAYTAPIPYVGMVTPRNRRVDNLARAYGAHTFDTLKSIFRDHFEGEINAPRWGAGSGAFPAVCMHAATYKSSQTAASMLVTYHPGIGPVLRQAYAQPCCSVYIPAYVGFSLPSLMSRGGGTFDTGSLWWLIDRLAKLVTIDYEHLVPIVQSSARELEQNIELDAVQTETQAAKLSVAGRIDEARALLYALMDRSSRTVADWAIEQYKCATAVLKADGITSVTGPRGEFLKRYCGICGIELLA